MCCHLFLWLWLNCPSYLFKTVSLTMLYDSMNTYIIAGMNIEIEKTYLRWQCFLPFLSDLVFFFRAVQDRTISDVRVYVDCTGSLSCVSMWTGCHMFSLDKVYLSRNRGNTSNTLLVLFFIGSVNNDIILNHHDCDWVTMTSILYCIKCCQSSIVFLKNRHTKHDVQQPGGSKSCSSFQTSGP